MECTLRQVLCDLKVEATLDDLPFFRRFTSHPRSGMRSVHGGLVRRRLDTVTVTPLVS